jgi:hypothetical protein
VISRIDDSQIARMDARALLGLLREAPAPARATLANRIANHGQSFPADLVRAVAEQMSGTVDSFCCNPNLSAEGVDLALRHFAGAAAPGGARHRTRSLMGATMAQIVRDAVLIAIRRGVFFPSRDTLDALSVVAESGTAPGWDLRSWLNLTRRALESGVATTARMHTWLLPEYIQQEQLDWGTDSAGQRLASHQYASAESILRLLKDYPSSGLAGQVARMAVEGKAELLRTPGIRAPLRAFLREKEVATALVLAPDPEDFADAVRSIWREIAHRRTTLEDPRVSTQALGWLPEKQRLELLQDASPGLRLKMIQAIGRGAAPAVGAAAPPDRRAPETRDAPAERPRVRR